MTLDRQAAHTPPSCPWRPGWDFRSSTWSGVASREGEVELHTLATPGDFAPRSSPPPWSFHLGLGGLLGAPETRFLANGFLLGFPKTDPDAYFDLFTVAPGQIVGCGNLKVSPSLFCPECEVREDSGRVYVETPDGAVVLRFERHEDTTRLCLAVSTKGLETATALAEQGLQADLSAVTANELRLRAPFWSHHRRSGGDQEMLAHALERMVYRLEPATGQIKGLWVRGEDLGTAAFTLRNLYPVVRAWLEIDTGVAAGLLQTALQSVSALGRLPYALNPQSGPRTACSTWPLLASSAWILRKTPQAGEFLRDVLPTLHAYLRGTLSYFDPQSTGTPVWRDSQEAVVEDTFDENLCTADLSAMLMREIDFFLELVDEHPDIQLDASSISLARERMAEHLLNQSWDSGAGFFRDHYLGGDPVVRMTLSGIFPLFWPALDEPRQKLLLAHVGEKGALRRKSGIAGWQMWETDSTPPPVLPAHQLLLLDSIHRIHPRLALQLAEACRDALRHAMSRGTLFPAQLSSSDARTEEGATVESEIQGACLALLCGSSLFSTRAEAAPKFILGLEKHRFLVGVSAMALVAVGVVAAALRTLLGGTLSADEQTAALGLLDRQLATRDFVAARQHIDSLSGKMDKESLDFYAGLAAFEEGLFEEAVAHFRAAAESEDRGAQSMMNLALSRFRQGKLDEAEKAYREVLQRYEDKNPEIAQVAKVALNVLEENRVTLQQALQQQEKNSPPAETDGESP